MATKKSTSARQHHDISVWEWFVAAIGALLLIAVVAFTIYRIGETRDPAAFTIEVESVVEAGGGYLANLRITNTGDETAAALTLEGKLMQGGEEVEASTATLTYVPANSTRNAAMVFTKDPRMVTLEIRPLGFEKP